MKAVSMLKILREAAWIKFGLKNLEIFYKKSSEAGGGRFQSIESHVLLVIDVGRESYTQMLQPQFS